MRFAGRAQNIQLGREGAYALVLVVMFLLLAGQVFSLQVVQHRTFLAKSLGNKIQAIPLLPPRGEIYDRSGKPLAVNRPSYTLKYFPPVGDAKDDETLAFIADWIETDPAKLAESVNKQKNLLYSYQPVTVAEDLPLERVAYIEENRRQFPGCYVDAANTVRSYPLGSATAHLIGYTAQMTEKEFTGRKAAGYLANEPLGKEGIERQYESDLRGALGERDIEVDRNRYFKRVVVEKPPKKGRDIYLTIDSRIQTAAYNALGGRRGAAVVMNPNTGEVLALASSPSYNPNLFRSKEGVNYFARIISDKRYPMLNRSVGNAYAPGSTVKPAIVLGALESGDIGRNATFYCPGFLEIGNRKFYCWQRNGHGTLGLLDVIGKSCDVAMYHIGLKMGVNGLRNVYEEFGYGTPTGIDLPNEASGMVPSRDWKRKHYSGKNYGDIDRMWFDGDTANMAIGQGFMLATPIQVLQMASTIACGGKTAKPVMVKGMESAGEVDTPVRDAMRIHNFEEQNIQLVRSGMRRAALMGGTADTMAGLRVSVACKTGTAEVWNGEPHSWFIGYFPAKEPQVSVVVFLENGGASSTGAVPAAKQLIAQITNILDL